MAGKVEITALSLGAGWGSTGMALMIEAGLIDVPKPDLAVFADTQAEPPHVYETLEWLQGKLSYPVVVATAGDLWTDTWKLINGEPTKRRPNVRGWTDLPLFGVSGIMKRQCTGNYKVEVVKKAIRDFAEAQPPNLAVVEYMGISLDEIGRMRDSQVAYINLRYPLIEARITRAAILTWMQENFPEAPIRRSACFFCPFHSISEWREIRRLYPGLYEESVRMDRALRQMPAGPFYLYSGKYGVGLEEAMANADRQGMLWPELDQFENECGGNCGV